MPTPSGPTDLKMLSHTFLLREHFQGGRDAGSTGRVGEPTTPDSPKESYSTNFVFVRSEVAGRIPMVAVGVPACGVKGRLARLLHRDCARTKRLWGRSWFCWRWLPTVGVVGSLDLPLAHQWRPHCSQGGQECRSILALVLLLQKARMSCVSCELDSETPRRLRLVAAVGGALLGLTLQAVSQLPPVDPTRARRAATKRI